MNTLVTYYSQTGNTEKLARAIYETIGRDKEILPINDATNIAGYDLIFIGFPTQDHSVPLAAQSFIQKLPAGQHIAFFSTHGSLRGGRLPKQAFEHAFSLAIRAKILGHFGSRGQVSPKLIEHLMQKPEYQAWVEEAQGAMGHPNAADLEDARGFARMILAKYLHNITPQP